MDIGAQDESKLKTTILMGSSSNNRTVESTVIVEKPMSSFIPMTKLIVILSKFLHPKKMHVIKKIHKGYLDKKFTRREMVNLIRKVVRDDDLIVKTIKYFNKKAVSKALFRAHVEGQLKSEIMANSDYHYTNKMMHYAFNRYLQSEIVR
ncbi:uncharacterized protein A4U43_C01F19980 [Asparagus officinalis]|uniref:RST domain-containing protein n=1 Tax=Asparagus officinalis TaxID=4686 RepID=A0A5P1FV91_ASPOF|nr:uncharacterized protein A4U43_C01F19980 [Asparagus officinalis]